MIMKVFGGMPTFPQNPEKLNKKAGGILCLELKFLSWK